MRQDKLAFGRVDGKNKREARSDGVDHHFKFELSLRCEYVFDKDGTVFSIRAAASRGFKLCLFLDQVEPGFTL